MLPEISISMYLAGLLGLGIAAQWLAWRLRLPAIVLLLAFGFAVGQLIGPPDQFIGHEVLFPLVSLAVGVILLEGGLSLTFSEVRETGSVVVRLVTIGLLVTWVLTALAARFLLGFSIEMSVLIGALLTVSGPTVILPMLRHVRPNRRIGSLVKWEGIVNDPIGAVLATLVFSAVAMEFHDQWAAEMAFDLGKTILVGGVLGAGGAWLILSLLKRFLIPDYLENPAILALVVVLFAISNQLQHEAGLITVTLFGIILANQRSVTVHHVVEFKENLRVLLISTLFIVLASRVSISGATLSAIGWKSLLFALVLMFVVRPIATLIATFGSELTLQERIFLGWIHPRGIVAAAVASLFALHLAESPFAKEAEDLVFATFVVIVTTVTGYGLTLGPLARRLGLSRSNPQGVAFAGASPLVRDIAAALQEEGFHVLLIDTNVDKIAAARLAGLPVCLAAIGSEFVHEEIDLGDIGRLLAMTPNDEVNTLATMEFVEHFGRAGVYQLSPREPTHGRYERIPSHRRGRILFENEATFEALQQRWSAGVQIKRTPLTDDFTYDDFLTMHGDSALVLFVIDEDENLHVSAAIDSLTPKPGQKVIAVVGAEEDKE